MRNIEPQPKLAHVRVGDGWVVTHHQLYALEPTQSGGMNFNGLPVWSFAFVQDLLQIHGHHSSLLIDVGWYPEGDEQGEYVLVLLEKNDRGGFNWDIPKWEYRTRSLEDLLVEIERVTSGNDLQ